MDINLASQQADKLLNRNQASTSHTANFSALVNPNNSTPTVRLRSAGEILLDYIDNLRSEKLRNYVDQNIDAETLIDEFYNQATSAIDLFTQLIDAAQLSQSEKVHLELARKRTANGLEWLQGLI